MSLLLDRDTTPPTRVQVMPDSKHVLIGEGDKQHEVSMEDFCDMVMNVMTVTDLVTDGADVTDTRAMLFAKIGTLKLYAGHNCGGVRFAAEVDELSTARQVIACARLNWAHTFNECCEALKGVLAWLSGPEGPDTLFHCGVEMKRAVEAALTAAERDAWHDEDK